LDIDRRGIAARAAGKPRITMHHGAGRTDLAAEGTVVQTVTVTRRRRGAAIVPSGMGRIASGRGRGPGTHGRRAVASPPAHGRR
jgi:hypothetical protein